MLTIAYYEFGEVDTIETFSDFDDAVQFCEDLFGYSGEAWEEVKDTSSLVVLHEFLVNDGVDADWEQLEK